MLFAVALLVVALPAVAQDNTCKAKVEPPPRMFYKHAILFYDHTANMIDLEITKEIFRTIMCNLPSDLRSIVVHITDQSSFVGEWRPVSEQLVEINKPHPRDGLRTKQSVCDRYQKAAGLMRDVGSLDTIIFNWVTTDAEKTVRHPNCSTREVLQTAYNKSISSANVAFDQLHVGNLYDSIYVRNVRGVKYSNDGQFAGRVVREAELMVGKTVAHRSKPDAFEIGGRLNYGFANLKAKDDLVREMEKENHLITGVEDDDDDEVLTSTTMLPATTTANFVVSTGVDAKVNVSGIDDLKFNATTPMTSSLATSPAAEATTSTTTWISVFKGRSVETSMDGEDDEELQPPAWEPSRTTVGSAFLASTASTEEKSKFLGLYIWIASFAVVLMIVICIICCCLFCRERRERCNEATPLIPPPSENRQDDAEDPWKCIVPNKYDAQLEEAPTPIATTPIANLNELVVSSREDDVHLPKPKRSPGGPQLRKPPADLRLD